MSWEPMRRGHWVPSRRPSPPERTAAFAVMFFGGIIARAAGWWNLHPIVLGLLGGIALVSAVLTHRNRH